MENNEKLIKYFTIENKNGLKTSEKYLKEKNFTLYKNIIEWCTKHNFSDVSFKEKIFIYIKQIDSHPKCNNVNCNNDVKFQNSLIKGYRKYCSRECSGNACERIENVKISNLNKYGVENVFNIPEIQEKVKLTIIEKYGVDNVFKCEIIKNQIKLHNLNKYGNENAITSDIIKEKIKSTMIERYGVDHYSKTEDFKMKYKNTMIERYGVDNPQKSIEIKKKHFDYVNNKLYLRFQKKGYEIINFEQHNLTIIHPDGHVFNDDRRLIINRFNVNSELSTILLPRYSSNGEETLYNYIQSIVDTKCLRNKRKIIKNFEIDIYLPDYKIGIELDGLYWHSDVYKNKDYHLNKTEVCEVQGIQLLHVFEDEWMLKREIVKSIIKSKLGLIDTKLFARKCEIREINDNQLVRNFLETNHLQGFVGSNVKIGLFHNNELVSLMTFGKKRLSMGNKTVVDGEYEMLRFCNKLNTQVIGGASKLLKHFVINYQPKSILTFADRRYSNGDLYKQLGFEHIGNTKPNYWYFTNNSLIRHYRFGFRKDVLVKEGCDSTKTEHEIMSERGYLKIYDCGNMKFLLKLV